MYLQVYNSVVAWSYREIARITPHPPVTKGQNARSDQGFNSSLLYGKKPSQGKDFCVAQSHTMSASTIVFYVCLPSSSL